MTKRNDPEGASRATGLEEQDASVTRSEEELRITTVRRPTQRARLAKYVETEITTRTVEVRHEQVRIELEPIASRYDDLPATGKAADQAVGWVVLYDEEVVVTTRRVPRERVRLRTRSVIEHRQISDVLHKERIEIGVENPAR